ncbi:ketoacyl-synthetase C-terminal extension domain-containing protein [Variovorax sp. NFACC26]|uniref:ketoacyl-synthetase C-terminal extension domain-containing protein n=1 Tax=Variovorax sp. NFACC26 TaxID=1566275 RepID=UPI003AAF6474
MEASAGQSCGEPQREYPRIAGISSFGAGGSNAHVIVQEYRAAEPARARVAVTPQRPAVVVLSARREERLREAVQRLLAHVERQGARTRILRTLRTRCRWGARRWR